MTIITHSEAETTAAGRDLAARLDAGSIVLLFGDLGAGKTAFVRGIALGLGVPGDEVSSPTFTIVQQYGGGRLPLLHVDLYRLQPHEVDDLGLDELGERAVTAIEWAERLPRQPRSAISITLRHTGEGDREISICIVPAA